MSNIEHDYLRLLDDILHNGVEKKDRTGTGTISVFGRQIRHKMSEGFPLLTTKKMAFKTMVTELLWFLKGDTNIKYLVENGCNIWNGDAYKNYKTNQRKPKIGDWENYIDCYCGHTDTCDCGPLSKKEFIEKIKTDSEFAEKWGELGPIYGKQWRDWQSETLIPTNLKMDGNVHYVTGTKRIDQIKHLINDLKTNPDSRRLMVSAWNVGELDQMVLPPCHYGFQCYVRDGKYLSLMWNQRSVDTFLGLPFNIASYGLLLEIIAKEVNMVPDELIGNLGDVHLYSNHIEQAKEQITRKPMNLPTLEISEVDVLKGEIELELKNYLHHKPIKAPLSN